MTYTLPWPRRGRIAIVLVLVTAGLCLAVSPARAAAAPAGSLLAPEHSLVSDPAETETTSLADFPPPELLRTATRTRNLGIGLVVYGAAASLAGFSLTLAGIREFQAGLQLDGQGVPVGEETSFFANLPVTLTLGTIFQQTGFFALVAGLPVVSHGGQMRAQLLRTVRGDEKLPRAVAVQRAYWKAHMRWHLGQALAMVGGLGTIPALLVTVGTIFAVSSQTEEDSAGGPPLSVLIVPAFWTVTLVTLIGGMSLLRSGRKQMQEIRESHRRRREQRLGLQVAPILDPFQRTVGLRLSGTF